MGSAEPQAGAAAGSTEPQAGAAAGSAEPQAVPQAGADLGSAERQAGAGSEVPQEAKAATFSRFSDMAIPFDWGRLGEAART